MSQKQHKRKRVIPTEEKDSKVDQKRWRKNLAILSLPCGLLGALVFWLAFSTYLLYAPYALFLLLIPPTAAIVTGILGLKSTFKGVARAGTIIGMAVLLLYGIVFAQMIDILLSQ